MLKYLEIKNNLKAFVSTLASGEKLPSRVYLANKFHTTRATLDKAIKELEVENILSSRKGSGTYVANSFEGSIPGTMNWCVIVPNIAEKIYGDLVSGIESVAQHYNANVILCNSGNDINIQNKFIQRLIGSGVSGFIIVPVIMNNPTENAILYSNLLLSKIPFVFCNRSVDGVSAPVVTSNDFYGGYIATKHLIQKGYKKIAFISKHTYKTSRDRCQGYLSALLERNIEINRKLIIMPQEKKDPNLYIDMVGSLIEKREIDAAFCFNDTIAIEVSKEITKRGIKLSDEIGVIGYDNIETSPIQSPSISSVAYKSKEIGIKAAEVLYNNCTKQQTDTDFQLYLFMPEIIERESCKGKE